MTPYFIKNGFPCVLLPLKRTETLLVYSITYGWIVSIPKISASECSFVDGSTTYIILSFFVSWFSSNSINNSFITNIFLHNIYSLCVCSLSIIYFLLFPTFISFHLSGTELASNKLIQKYSEFFPSRNLI